MLSYSITRPQWVDIQLKTSPVNNFAPTVKKTYVKRLISNYLKWNVCHLTTMSWQNIFLSFSRDLSVYGLSQWETTFHCNVVSHWLSAYTEWSLSSRPIENVLRCVCVINQHQLLTIMLENILLDFMIINFNIFFLYFQIGMLPKTGVLPKKKRHIVLFVTLIARPHKLIWPTSSPQCMS